MYSVHIVLQYLLQVKIIYGKTIFLKGRTPFTEERYIYIQDPFSIFIQKLPSPPLPCQYDPTLPSSLCRERERETAITHTRARARENFVQFTMLLPFLYAIACHYLRVVVSYCLF